MAAAKLVCSTERPFVSDLTRLFVSLRDACYQFSLACPLDFSLHRNLLFKNVLIKKEDNIQN